MLNILILAGALAQAGTPSPAPAAPVPAATSGRTLKDLPGATIAYYDVAGKNGSAIQKSFDALLKNPAAQDSLRLFTWDVGTQIVKATVGAKCTIQSAKSTLTAKVRLPRLTEEAKVPKDVQANWKTYVAGVEGEAAATLWFLSDRLRGAEKSLVGKPCDQASPAWNAQLANVKTELDAFVAQRAQAVAAKRTQTVPKSAPKENDTEDKMKPR